MAAVDRPSPLLADSSARLLLPWTVGVGQRFAAAARSSFWRLPPLAPSDARGVGHIPCIAIWPKDLTGPHFVVFAPLFGGPPSSGASIAIGVGKAEPPPTKVWGANGRSRYAVPDAVITEGGQLPDHGSSVPVSKDAWNVLQQDPMGSHVPNGPNRRRPEIAFVSSPGPQPGGAVGLARESRSDEVHQSGQSSKIGAPHVPDDGRPVKESVPDSGLEHLLAVFVNLNVTYGLDGQPGQAKAQAEALVAGKQAEMGQHGPRHRRG